MALDTNYGATQKEKDYVKETLEKEGVTKLFNQELHNLSTKIIRNFHNDNYLNFETNNIFDTEKQSMKEIINSDPEMKTKYETALTKNKEKGGFSEGILLLQSIAIKCITILSNNEEIEKKLTSWNDSENKSQAMDGIMGPNTFYVLASIAKEKGIPFNGIVDTTLLDEMINICKEEPVDNNNNNTPIDNNNTPIDNNNTPIDNNNTPIDNNNTPIDNNNTPIDNNNTPIDNNNTPIDNNNTPIDNNNTPIDNNQITTPENGKSAETVKAIKEIQEKISKYTITPNTYTISSVQGDRVFDYTDTEDKTQPLLERITSINYMIKNNDIEIGMVGFDIQGQLLTKEIKKGEKTYTITQTENTIKIEEKQEETSTLQAEETDI